MKTCVGCGVEFQPNVVHQRYCDNNCAQRTYRRNNRTVTYPYPSNCVVCGIEIQKKKPSHKYCSKRCYHKVYDRSHLREKSNAWQRRWARANYDKTERYHSKITDREDFIEFIKRSVLKRRGDMLNVKSLARRAVKELDLDWHRSEYRKVYHGIAEICRSLGGQSMGKNSRDSLIYQWERKK